jgi:hypothetical protein
LRKNINYKCFDDKSSRKYTYLKGMKKEGNLKTEFDGKPYNIYRLPGVGTMDKVIIKHWASFKDEDIRYV